MYYLHNRSTYSTSYSSNSASHNEGIILYDNGLHNSCNWLTIITHIISTTDPTEDSTLLTSGNLNSRHNEGIVKNCIIHLQ